MILKIQRRSANRDSDTGWIDFKDIPIKENMELPIRVEDRDILISLTDIYDDCVLVEVSDYYYIESTDIELSKLKEPGGFIEDNSGIGTSLLFNVVPIYVGKEVKLKSPTFGQVEYIGFSYVDE